MSSPQYTSLLEAINTYQSSVKEVVDNLKRVLALDLSFIVGIPIILSVVAYFFAGVAGFLTTLGLGGINAGERLTRGHTIIKTYWGDCAKLRKTILTLQIRLQLCKQKRGKLQPKCFQDVEDLLIAYLKELPTA